MYSIYMYMYIYKGEYYQQEDGAAMGSSVSFSVVTRPLVGGAVPHCFAVYMYLTAPLPNHTCTSLFTLVQYHALSFPASIYQVLLTVCSYMYLLNS